MYIIIRILVITIIMNGTWKNQETRTCRGQEAQVRHNRTTNYKGLYIVHLLLPPAGYGTVGS